MKQDLTIKKFNLFTKDKKKHFIEVYFHDENIWLSQKLMSELFDVGINTINEHLKNVFSSGELESDSVIRNFRITANDGKNYQVKFYNLDAIISVGYRVNSKKATDFRIWATKHLKEFILKGFVLDDERLKQGQDLDKNYFKELLERIRSIRASERRIYQQITDIFAECATDYDKYSSITKDFFATVQNKFHYAITEQTAAEIIYQTADHAKENMGLKTWQGSPDKRILKSDVLTAKNYLEEKQIKQLERTISGFFDYIEGLVERKNSFTMQEFKNAVDKFLDFQEYKILEGKGKISKAQAEQKAKGEYDIFNKHQKIESDFDQATKKYLEGKK